MNRLLDILRLLVCLWALLLAGCPEGRDDTDADGRPRLKLQLNWVPEPEFGGYYAAREMGAFAAERLDVVIQPGGPGVPVVPMVAAGQADFGITSADSLLVARERGVDIVAVFALYQTFPEGIMEHAERGLTSIGEVFAGGTLAMEAGTPYHRLLEQRYGFRNIRAVPYSNNLGPFLHDRDFAQQCFITAEPVAARRAGAHPQVFPISDIGYNPYGGVVFTRRRLLDERPEQVAALIRAIRLGWSRYMSDPAPINAVMHGLNPTMDPDTFAEAAAIQQALITGPQPGGTPLGQMSLERWRTLATQLGELGLISRVAPESAFVNP